MSRLLALAPLAAVAALTTVLLAPPASAPLAERGGRPEPPAAAPVDAGSLPVVDTHAQPGVTHARLGQVFAAMAIPRLWGPAGYGVVEGIRQRDLHTGMMAHYPMTPMPGERGNVAFAAHRWDGPLYDFERLRVGDRITVIVDRHRWVYAITTAPRIIDVDDVWVIDAIPGHKRDRMLTLTTCWPKNGSSRREYVRARLIERSR